MSGLWDILRRRDDEPPIEMLDAEMLRSRIGDPLRPKKKTEKPAPAPNGYRRSDGPPEEGRSWRRVAGLTR